MLISRDISEFYNSYHGNCYTFNAAWNTAVSVSHTSTMPGRRYGEFGIISP